MDCSRGYGFKHSLELYLARCSGRRSARESLRRGGAGVRAQAMSPEGGLVQDFHFTRGTRALHVLNAPSPAATASLAIGTEIINQLEFN